MTDFSLDNYNKQLEAKRSLTVAEFSPFFESGECELEVFDSPIQHYRLRAEFRVWHDVDELYYIMFNQETKEKYRVDSFPIAAKVINELMPIIIEKVLLCPILKKRLFQIDYLSTLSGEVSVSLLYHKELTDEWEESVIKLREALIAEGFSIHFVGRSRKMKRSIQRDYVVEKLHVHDKVFTYHQVENSFTQPNGTVAEKMLEWAVTHTQDSTGDLLELYCGNGNFSVALAQNFNRVLATELAKPSVESAHWNIEKNKVTNLKIARLSAEELTEAMKGERLFFRLTQQNIDLTSYDFKTVLVDPPRAGIDDKSLKMLQGYDRIIYISCNPNTLKDNLEILKETHSLSSIALFDQFPYTSHREVGVILNKR